jgi:hypothetical protein
MAEIANLNTRLSLESASFISGIEKSRGALRSLIASIDPAAAAQAKFNRETQLLDGALKRGQLSAEAYARGMDVLRGRLNAAVTQQGAVATSTGNLRSGMQQLSFQLGDIATQWSSGTKPMVIFAQQGGQVIQALQMMTNSTKGLLGFLGGPWGQVITAAAVVLTPLIAKLWESEDASKKAADGVDSYTDALKRLQDQGGAFNFGSEQFAKVSKEVLEAEARVQRLRREAATAATQTGPRIVTGAGWGAAATGDTPRTRDLVLSELRGAEALAAARRGDLNALLMQRSNRNIADERPDRERRPRKPPADRSAQIEQQYEDELSRILQEQLRARLEITSDLTERHEIEAELQAEERKQRLRAIDSDKDLSEERKKVLKDALGKLYGRENETDPDGEIGIGSPGLYARSLARKLEEQILQRRMFVTSARLDLEAEDLQSQRQNARTARERREIELRLLELAIERQRETVKNVEALQELNKATAEQVQAEKDRLAFMEGVGRQRATESINRGTMGPMAQYLDRIPRTAAEMNEAFERVAADGLSALNDGLADAIAGTRSLGDVFRNVSAQIIADLMRIAIQRNITEPLANSLFSGGGGGGGGFFAKLFGGSSSAVSSNAIGAVNAAGASAAGVVKMAAGGSLRVGGFPGIDRNVLSINGQPRALVSDTEMVHVTPPGRAANNNETVVRIMLNDQMLDARIVSGSGTVIGKAAKGAARTQRQSFYSGKG